jgi:hypothetical protein
MSRPTDMMPLSTLSHLRLSKSFSGHFGAVAGRLLTMEFLPDFQSLIPCCRITVRNGDCFRPPWNSAAFQRLTRQVSPFAPLSTPGDLPLSRLFTLFPLAHPIRAPLIFSALHSKGDFANIHAQFYSTIGSGRMLREKPSGRQCPTGVPAAAVHLQPEEKSHGEAQSGVAEWRALRRT